MFRNFFSKLTKVYSVRRYYPFRKLILRKQVSFSVGILLLLCAFSVIGLIMRLVPDTPDKLFLGPTLATYLLPLILSAPLLFVMLKYNKDCENNFKKLECCCYATVSLLPVWTLIVLLLPSSEDGYSPIVWAIGILAFSGSICLLPLYSLSFLLVYFGICATLFHFIDIDFGPNKWTDLVILEAVAIMVSTIRFLREYDTFCIGESMSSLAEEADAARQSAEKASNAKDAFLTHMSHEIRTPINAILGSNELITRKTTDPEIRSYADDIMNSGNLLLSTINDILDMSRIESGSMEIVSSPYSFVDMLHETDECLRPLAVAKKLSFIMNIDERTPSKFCGDSIRVRQIITNLLSNAIKYTKHGSVTLTTDFSLLPKNRAELQFTVSDTGIGIKSEDIVHLTDRFRRIDDPDTRGTVGTGLGMTITSRLLELMEGRLEISSEYGVGSTFTVYIPQSVEDYHPIGRYDPPAQTPSMQIGAGRSYAPSFKADTCRILIVDDNMVNRTIARDLLKETGLQIDLADSGFSMLDMIKEKHYDLIFLDHYMPGLNGIETIRRCHETDHLCKETPIIALSANSDSGAREDYLREGFADFLLKPIIPAQFEAMIQKYLPSGSYTPLV
ncbi:MAG: response regulator [Lachnospiraceae bacterium]|nr:response regulator [Lachnospiraceae bacterium]